MDAQGMGHDKLDGRMLLPSLRERERDIVLHMPRGKQKQRQDDNGVGPLRQLAKRGRQRRAGQLHIAVRDVKIRTPCTIGRHQRLKLDVRVGIAAAVSDDEQSRAHEGCSECWDVNGVSTLGAVTRCSHKNEGIKKPPSRMGNKRSHAKKAGAILRYRAEKPYYVSSDRSPGSWVQKVEPSPLPPAFPNTFVEWLKRESFPLTVAGPRRFFTGLPCYALAGIREIAQLSAQIPNAG
ncbi:hypothetical protein NSPZN2_40627 [Nitrospira defluvii]|uniref:Uncharacterized protein n=1 Tax=Nitrospira defluvii TaxID=330214 RepID=A0ABN7M1F1_9BACT|nr:hypothetical protein NSPZN2_40627 [Nitrospira defluvii]